MAGFFAAGQVNGAAAPPSVYSKIVKCSPAPCVLQPTQVSEGGAEVTDAPAAADPLELTHLLLGSVDFNCEFSLGFFASSDGGSGWNRTCPTEGIGPYFPSDNPMVGYDRKGVAYIAGIYYHSGYNRGLIGIESSADGTNWSQPVTALKEGEDPFYPWLAIDTNVGSPYLNDLYISAVIESDDGANNRLYVSHSYDGGSSWQAVPVATTQSYPALDAYSNLAVSKDGTVYLTWMYCPGSGPYANCAQSTEHMVLSR